MLRARVDPRCPPTQRFPSQDGKRVCFGAGTATFAIFRRLARAQVPQRPSDLTRDGSSARTSAAAAVRPDPGRVVCPAGTSTGGNAAQDREHDGCSVARLGWCRSWDPNGAGASTLAEAYRLMGVVMNTAVADEVIGLNPCRSACRTLPRTSVDDVEPVGRIGLPRPAWV